MMANIVEEMPGLGCRALSSGNKRNPPLPNSQALSEASLLLPPQYKLAARSAQSAVVCHCLVCPTVWPQVVLPLQLPHSGKTFSRSCVLPWTLVRDTVILNSFVVYEGMSE